MVLETAGVGSAGLLQLVGSGVAGCMGARPDQARPIGNKNALKHGRFTREAKVNRRRVQASLRQSRQLLSDIVKCRFANDDVRSPRSPVMARARNVH